ncbi:MAG: DUF975 family protein [Oscillospiraceae bacterium]
MNFNRYETKMRAKEAIRQTKPKAMWVTLIYLLLTSLVTMVLGFLTPNPALQMVQMELANGGSLPPEAMTDLLLQSVAPAFGIGLFFSILVGLFSMVMQYGYCGYCIKVFRHEEAGFGTLFNGFGIAGKVVGSGIMVGIFTSLWTLAVMVPTMIAIGLIVYVLDSPFAVFLVALIYIAMLVAVLIITLRYAMVPYILMDNGDVGVFAAINQSKELMRGHIKELFVLQISFIGWYLLYALIVYIALFAGIFITFFAMGGMVDAQSILQMGGFVVMMFGMILLGFLLSLPLMMWLTSYVGVATAGFYDRFVIHVQEGASAQEQTMPPVYEDVTPESKTPENSDPMPTLHGDSWGMNPGDKDDDGEA